MLWFFFFGGTTFFKKSHNNKILLNLKKTAGTFADNDGTTTCEDCPVGKKKLQ